jgi:hypothetical protein
MGVRLMQYKEKYAVLYVVYDDFGKTFEICMFELNNSVYENILTCTPYYFFNKSRGII